MTAGSRLSRPSAWRRSLSVTAVCVPVLAAAVAAATTARFSRDAAPAAARRVPVVLVDISVPELAWNTNVARLTLENPDSRPHELEIDVQSRHLSPQVGGFGWQTRLTLAPQERRTLDRDFIVKALPGRVRVRFAISDLTDGVGALRDCYADFPVRNTRINALKLPPALRGAPGAKAEYPPLKMAERGRFVFYHLADDSFTAARLDDIGARRNRAYDEVTSALNPGYREQVAVILFPDEASKAAHMGHRGLGWAPGGNVLVEIFNERQHVDPNHELVHVVARTVGDPPALFSEGLAVYHQAGSKWDDWHVDAWVKAFRQAGMLMPIAALLERTEIGSDESRPAIAYPEAGSFVRFLASRDGWPKVAQAFRTMKRSGDAAAVHENAEWMRVIFGAPVADLEAAWLAAVAASPEPAVPAATVQEIKAKLAAGR